MVTIKADRLTKRFDSVIAVDNLQLEIEEGEIFGLVGPDGAGKTTTMRLLTGILEPDSGDAWVSGESIRNGSRSPIRESMTQWFSISSIFKKTG